MADPRDMVRVRRPAELARNVSLLVSTVVRHVIDDPLLLVVQGARRLPNRARGPVARLVGAGARRGGVRRAFAAFVADRHDVAREILAGGDATGAVAAELCAQLGLPVPTTGSAAARARALWNVGDVSGAIEAAESSRSGRRYAARLRSERLMMRTGFRLTGDDGTTSRHGARPAGSTGRADVLHVLTNSVPHTQSGYALRSQAVLAAQQHAGLAVRAVTRVGYPVSVGRVGAHARDVVEGVRYDRLLPWRLEPLPHTRLQQMADETFRVVHGLRPQVLHTTTNFANALVAEAVARRLMVPWVYEVRGVLEETWVASRPADRREEAAASERFALLRAKETELMRAADRVVVLSEVSRQALVSRGVSAERIVVVPNGIDAALLDRDVASDEARARIGLPADGFWVGTVSSLVDYEGFDVLLHAVRQMRDAGLDARAVIAGDGVTRPGLAALAEELELSDAVVLPGRVAPDQAWLWHRALDVFAVPRRDLPVCRSVTPLKPIEAMAAGRPVVASDLPALAEIVAAPGAGVVVPAEDARALAAALAELEGDPGLRGRYGVAGRRFAATRTWQANGEVYRRMYEELGVRV